MSYRLSNAIWEITLKCNLKCLHCGSSAGEARNVELTTEEAYTRVFHLIRGSRFQKVLLNEMQSLKRKRLYEKLPIDEQALGI